MRLALKRVRWERTHRLIASQIPTVGPFDGLVADDPIDAWIAADLETKSNPRLQDAWVMTRIAPERMVWGPGSAYLVAPFVKLGGNGGRFNTAAFGAYYTADAIETAVAEVSHHVAIMRRASASPPQEFTFRELVGSLDVDLDDVVAQAPADVAACLDPDDYARSQTLAAGLRSAGADGIAYPSIRRPGGVCAALFHPNLMLPPVQGLHPQMRWDGRMISHWRPDGAARWKRL